MSNKSGDVQKLGVRKQGCPERHLIGTSGQPLFAVGLPGFQ